jgi:NADH-quinone oxidoreductase subunit L
MVYGDFFKDAITVDADKHPALHEMAMEFHGPAAMALHAFSSPVFWLALAGVVVAWWFYMKQPSIPAAIARIFSPVYRLLENKYYMDWINENLIAPLARGLGRGLWKGGDVGVIDGLINGSARAVGGIAQIARVFQTGYLYWYALVMILGVFALMTWQLWPELSSLIVRAPR